MVVARMRTGKVRLVGRVEWSMFVKLIRRTGWDREVKVDEE